MPFAFPDKDRSVAKSVRKLARNRIEASLALLEDDARPRAERVRELRKNIKKIRALIRLVRPNFKTFDREDAALKDAGRMIADLRDSDALAECFDTLSRRLYTPLAARETLREVILHPRAAIVEQEAADRLAGHGRLIAAIMERLSGWKISGTGFDALSPGLERTWSAAQKAMTAAMSEPTGEALHQWRKRAKDHWYHARLLAPIWPEMMVPHIAAADALGERLGEARDLAFLIEALAGVEGGEEFRAAAAEEEARLLADARRLGARFFSEPAGGLSRRWRGWWQIWRD
jgi:CHAD domain-containing protein